MKNVFLSFVILFSLTFYCIGMKAQTQSPDILSKKQKEFASWKYGMFLHFNMGTFTNKEWTSGYEDPLAFNPTADIDCGQWMEVAKKSGMKYAVLTVKHTGGWCLWNSKYTKHDITSFKNYKKGKGDIVRDFVNACRNNGIKVGLYYCLPGDFSGKLPAGKDDYHGLPLEAKGDYSGFIKKQVSELLTNYGKIDLLWFDQSQNKYTSTDWLDLKNTIHKLQPNCIVVANNEHNYQKTDIISYEYPYFKNIDMNMAVPPVGNKDVSELCDCIDSSERWFWHSGDKFVKSVNSIVNMLRRCNERSTNYLLDIPVGRDGKISSLYSNQLQSIWEKYTNGSNTSIETNEQTLKDWKASRFGMFIHWGPVALKGTEISWSRGSEVPTKEYDNLYKQFNPIKFNADEWVSIAKAAGMKYIVLTTKHHDGFCLWNTRQTDYNIMNTPFKRDVVKELAEACKKQGIKFGTYYSTCDWYHPDFPMSGYHKNNNKRTGNLDAYTTYLKRQIAELMLNYGPLEVLWFDVPQMFDAKRGQSVIDFAHNIQPDIIINNRVGAKGDYDTPEQKIGGFQNTRLWETNMTIANQWAWKPNDKVKSLEQCLQSLVRTAGGDGNFLFNVGPNAEGVIEPEQVERLKEMGQWLKEYGYTIYNTNGGPYKPTDWGVCTSYEKHIYLHILSWQGDKPVISLPDIGLSIKSCKLADGRKVKFTKRAAGYVLELPVKSLKPIDTIIDLEMSDLIKNIKPIDLQAQSLSYGKKVSASSNPDPTWHDIACVTNGDWAGHAWRPTDKEKKSWVEIDLGEKAILSKAILFEKGNNVKAYEIQAFIGDEWKTIYKGSSIGNRNETLLPKTKTEKVRLLLTDVSATPEIFEIILL